MTTDIVRWQDTPRLYVNVLTDPKHADLPKRVVERSLSADMSNASFDAAAAHYGSRIGYVVIGMFPHTYCPDVAPPVKPKAEPKPKAKPRKKAAPKVARHKDFALLATGGTRGRA